MILLDSNIFMYAAGAEHPHKAPSETLLYQVAQGTLQVGIDAEVLQEILHRYRAISRWEDGKIVFDLTRKLISAIFPIDVAALEYARDLLDQYQGISARDALHAAICFQISADGICSYDKGFDAIKGLRRYEPGEVVRR